jgi:hypothetical protein
MNTVFLFGGDEHATATSNQFNPINLQSRVQNPKNTPQTDRIRGFKHYTLNPTGISESVPSRH